MNDNRNTPESSPRTVQRSGTTSHGSVPAGLVFARDYVPKRSRGGWGRAGVFAAVACLAWLAWPTAAFAVTGLSVDTIATDDVLNISEEAGDFDISGTLLGVVGTVTVTVTIGSSGNLTDTDDLRDMGVGRYRAGQMRATLRTAS